MEEIDHEHFWDDCPDVERVEGKVSGQPVLVGTRIMADSIPGNYEGFVDGGASPEEAIAETLECFPGAGADRIRRMLVYYQTHELQPQP